MKLNTLRPAPGSRHRRKIVGRGEGSGHGGKGSTRGFKGQTARSGDKAIHPGFEGGQNPLIRRIPKRGFNNKTFRRAFCVVNVGDLEAVFEAGTAVAPDLLRSAGLANDKGPVKILGDGDLTKKFSVSAHAFSGSAKKKIEQAGGSTEILKAK
ncbi:MAG TPA: 50S ribosomal protein L15 [Elusimicrobiota bacterium]|nr:50S ribosomal protein L15 [Elusimicrobiota bacterium]